MVKREEHIRRYSIALVITFVVSVGGYFIYRSLYDRIPAYSNKVSNEEQTKIEDLIRENNNLMDENNNLKEQLAEKEKQFQQELERLSNDEMNKQKEQIAEHMDKLMEAQKHFYARQYVQCAEYLETIDTSLLGDKGKNLYDQLASTAFAKAAQELYYAGNNEFNKGNYQNAIHKLKKSYDYQKTQYFSDDSLYFLAYAYYKNGEYEKAKETALKLLQDYPDTTYKKGANILLSKIDNNNQQ